MIAGIEDHHVAPSSNSKSSVAFGIPSMMRGLTPAVVAPWNGGRLNFNVAASHAPVLHQHNLTPVGVRLNVEVSTVPGPVVRIADRISKGPSWIAGTRGIIASRNTADVEQGEIGRGARCTGSTTSTLGTSCSSKASRATSTDGATGSTSSTGTALAVLAGSTARTFHLADLSHLL